VIDVNNKVYGSSDLRDPVVFPAPDQKEVPRIFAHGLTEWPNPIPESGACGGYPITVTQWPTNWQPGEAEMSLTDGKEQVSCWFSSLEKPARKDWPQGGTVCLIPREPLKPSTTYTVTFKCKKYGVERTPDWIKTWSFTTGRN
jgi:hypothetical protein